MIFILFYGIKNTSNQDFFKKKNKSYSKLNNILYKKTS